tara:strand:- start:647 stop:829 length:183 start_codon:yes stop_codon:yes gene_type:complete
MTYTAEERDKIREAAGWERDDSVPEGSSWYAPHPDTGELMPEWDWRQFGLPYPEGKHARI